MISIFSNRPFHYFGSRRRRWSVHWCTRPFRCTLGQKKRLLIAKYQIFFLSTAVQECANMVLKEAPFLSFPSTPSSHVIHLERSVSYRYLLCSLRKSRSSPPSHSFQPSLKDTKRLKIYRRYMNSPLGACRGKKQVITLVIKSSCPHNVAKAIKADQHSWAISSHGIVISKRHRLLHILNINKVKETLHFRSFLQWQPNTKCV